MEIGQRDKRSPGQYEWLVIAVVWSAVAYMFGSVILMEFVRVYL